MGRLSIFLGLMVTAISLSCAPAPDASPVSDNGEPVPPPAESRQVLSSRFAGSWYPGTREALTGMLQDFVAQTEAREQAAASPIALILPHAGYRYSGRTAMATLQTVAHRSWTRIFLLGPSHRTPLPNRACLPSVTHFRTPLGDLAVDREYIDALLQHDLFIQQPGVHDHEHSLQMEMPLLQHLWPERADARQPRIVPIIIGRLDPPTARRLAARLRPHLDENTLVIVSSDFTHYGPNYGYIPFRDDVEANLKKLDLGAWEVIRALDPVAFTAYGTETGITICGQEPIRVLLHLLPSSAQAQLLRYDTSGRITGDFNNSVSYLGIRFDGSWKEGTPDMMEPSAPPPAPPLSAEEKQHLLQLARKTLDAQFREGKLLSPEQLGISTTPAMQQTRGAFVTLKQQGHLRGCIGSIFPVEPLADSVQHNALQAAFRDPRFPAVTEKELAGLHLEISALTPPREVTSTGEIVIGKHGIVLNKDGRRSVFLPQVATEQGWDLPTTLSYLAQKAGLPADAWREGTTFQVFEAEVFGEK